MARLNQLREGMSRFESVCLGRVVSTRAARSSQPGSTSFGKGDVVARLNQLREGMSRFESVCLGRVVSTRAARSSQPGSTGFGKGDVLARLNRLREGTKNKEPGRGSALFDG